MINFGWFVIGMFLGGMFLQTKNIFVKAFIVLLTLFVIFIEVLLM